MGLATALIQFEGKNSPRSTRSYGFSEGRSKQASCNTINKPEGRTDRERQRQAGGQDRVHILTALLYLNSYFTPCSKPSSQLAPKGHCSKGREAHEPMQGQKHPALHGPLFAGFCPCYACVRQMLKVSFPADPPPTAPAPAH